MDSEQKFQTKPQPASGPAAAPAFRPKPASVGEGSKEEARPLLPTPSLPKGGGAIRGLGEKFSTNPANGTASFQVPIATSPGRGGFGPTLSLSYDSGAGNGPFGLGWQLSAPAISRKTDRGLPRYRDDEDTFLLSGSEDLVPVPKGPLDPPYRDVEGVRYEYQRYQPRVEGAFARIERWIPQGGGGCHWRVTTPENVTNVYGFDESSRICDPDDTSRVFSWLLCDTLDDRGNVARYEYVAEDGSGVSRAMPSESSRFEGTSFRATAQRYLKRVLYGNATAFHPSPGERGAGVPATSWHFEVVFDYGEHGTAGPGAYDSGAWPVRPDPYSTFRSGFDVRTYRLCRRILGFHRFPELDGEYLVRSTDFDYDLQPTGTTLKSITQRGFVRREDGTYASESMPDLEFGYSASTLHDELLPLPEESLEGITDGVDGAASQWIDLDGEGIPGVVTATEGAWYYKANLGGGKLAAPKRLGTTPAPGRPQDGVQQLSDFTGEGRLSLVQYGLPLPGFFERTEDDGWQPFRAFQQVPNLDWKDPNLKFVDVDGDGIADVLVSENDVFVWYRSKGREGFEPAALVAKTPDENAGPAVVFADGTESIQLADMSGDGLSDIVRIRNGEICYWPNLGYGRFGRKITMDASPRFDSADQFDPRRVRFADLDGTGPSDLLYTSHEGVFFWLNRSGNAWGERQQIRALPVIDSRSRLGIVDLLGTGTSCLVLSSSLETRRRRPIAYVDILGSQKAHLLTSVVNNLGAETRIGYAPSTKFYLEDKAAGSPWVTRLAFPVQVVERVEDIDHITGTKLVTRYKYHHGYYDAYEREFRGFAFVEQCDAESFVGDANELGEDGAVDQPPVLTKTWFHTGAWFDHDRLETLLSAGYYERQTDGIYYLEQVEGTLLPRTPLPAGLSPHEEREAARALRGRMLRQEVYVEDGTAKSAHPYVVTERSYGLRTLRRAGEDAHAIFLPYDADTVTLQYERDPDDPRVVHELALAVDEYGNKTRGATVAYPRRVPGSGPEHDAQANPLVTITERSFLHRPNETTWYRLNVPYQESVWQLTGVPIDDRLLLTATKLDTYFTGASEAPFEEEVVLGERTRRLVARTRHRYLRDDLSGPLPWNELQSRALPYESYRLAFTQGLLDQVFGDRIDPDIVGSEGHYVRLDDEAWWVPSGRAIPSAGHFYQPVAAIDPFGETLSVAYDDHSLLMVSATDPVGNVVGAANDYRVLAPWKITDPNENRFGAGFDALGRVTKTALMGKEGAGEGDTLDDPTTRLTYDLLAWTSRGLPASVCKEAREQHGAANPRWQCSVVYSDGHGQEVMKKVQAEPGLAPKRDAQGALVRVNGKCVEEFTSDRWVGSGRTVFNNKGKPVKQYEPFFSWTSSFEDEADLVETGVTPILHYDPLDRLIRTEHPNGTEARVVFDAWTQETWDENDALVRPDGSQVRWLEERLDLEIPGGHPERWIADAIEGHIGTPGYVRFDVLGRPVLAGEDNGGAGTYETVSDLDILGNPKSVLDARGHFPAVQVFDLLKRPLRNVSCDAGDRRTLPDVGDKPIYTWDARETRVRRGYDGLQRPTHVYVTPPGGDEVLAERTFYGEGHPEEHERNLRGRPFASFDGAGVEIHDGYDFAGNLVHAVRRLAATWDAGVDWRDLEDPGIGPAGAADLVDGLLEGDAFETETAFDALGRVVTATSPDGSVTRPTYNEANLLERIDVRLRGAADWTPFVTGVDYNARGQRLRIDYGNGTYSAYSYDPERFRLVWLATTRSSDGCLLQDLAYTYDPVGNIVEYQDHAQPESFFDGEVVSALGTYEYDALYRLTRAQGREHPGQLPTYDDHPWAAVPHPNDQEALVRYEETYAYDEVGNILDVVHSGGNSWSRTYEYEPGSNRLIATTDPANQRQTYDHDADGNITRMPHLPVMEWDHAQRSIRTEKLGAGGTVHFAYDAAGKRVRKVFVNSSGNHDERVYLGSYELFRSHEYGSVRFERETLHVFDDKTRVALVETKTVENGKAIVGPSPVSRFQLAAYLPSVAVELDAAGQVISYEEYYPFGATSFHSQVSSPGLSQKRYRHLGDERDDETGLTQHGARLYAAWLGRWTAADPDGMTPTG